MYIRTLQLLSRFYMDQYHHGKTAILKPKGAEDMLLALGFYSAVCFYPAEPYAGILNEKQEQKLQKSAWQYLSDITADGMNGDCNVRNLTCIFEEQSVQPERLFWERVSDRNEGKPYLFVSMVHIKQSDSFPFTNFRDAIWKYRTEDTFAYYSTGYQEAVIVYRTNSYRQGLDKVKEIRRDFHVLKMNTVFSFHEKLFENEKQCARETVDCSLRAVVKDMGAAEAFIDEFRKQIKNASLVSSDILGRIDLLIQISHISLPQLLSYYRDGEILSFGRFVYEHAFYSVETEIEIKRMITGDSQEEESL